MSGDLIMAQAVVIGHGEDNGSVFVQFRTGQMPGAPVRMLYQGYADPLRVRQVPLPQRGTWGLVIFPNGDIRNGLWLGAYYPNQADALTTPATGTDPAMDYYAHWSGFWSLLDGGGNFAQQWPDGTSLTVAAATGVPTVYRHTVDDQQAQTKRAFTMAERVATTPAAFYLDLVHSTGLRVLVDVDGNLTITGNASGHGSRLTMTFGGTTLTMNTGVSGAQGNVSLALAGTDVFSITQGGAADNDFLVLVSKLITLFNNHVHSGIQVGGSNTGTPTASATVANLKAEPLKVST